MTRHICIGNQTGFCAHNPLEPFEFAPANGFDAFEWFADKKFYGNGGSSGWDVSEVEVLLRTEVKQIGDELDGIEPLCGILSLFSISQMYHYHTYPPIAGSREGRSADHSQL